MGLTPLHCGARYDHKNVAELLLANRADINAKNNGGFTPLARCGGLWLQGRCGTITG